MRLSRNSVTNEEIQPRHYSKLWRGVFWVVGVISLGLGFLGILLPLLPTTPFLLLSAMCLARSSSKLYIWLHTNRLFGNYLWRYRNKEGIPMKVKLFTVGLLWVTILFSVFLAIDASRLWLRILLLLIAIGVSLHVFLIRKYKEQ